MAKPQQNPAVIAREQLRADFSLRLAALHLAEPAGVPQLVAEVPAQLDILLVEQHVLAKRGAPHGAKAQGIRPVLRDQLERVGRITKALGHLPALLVADDAGEVDVAERQVALPLVACHYHPGDPEENNVRPGDEVGRRVKLLKRLRLLRPTHRGKRPKPRTAPSVQHVGILFPTVTLRRLEAAVNLLAPIPHRDAVPPPKLATDAPVLQATHPVVIRLGPALGIKIHRATGHAVTGLRLTRVFQKPLLGEARLDRHIGAFAEADVVFVFLRLEQRAHLLELGRGGLARLEAIHAGEFGARRFVHFAVVTKNIDHFQPVTLANVEVGLVVRRSDLEHSGPKLDVDVFVGDDG